MTRSTAWVFVLLLAMARLCHAQQLPDLRPMPKGKEPPPKAEPLPPPAKVADEQPKSPPPILFPAPPYPPPAPAVVDPRTGAWEQMHTPLEIDHELAVPVEGSGPIVHSHCLRAHLALPNWIYRFNHSGEGAGTIDLSTVEHSSDTTVIEVKPGH